MTEGVLTAPMRLFAPAKVNLSLEVIGKRPDGYHEVVTLLEAISVFDIIDLFPSDRMEFTTSSPIPTDRDLTRRAVERFADWFGLTTPVRVELTKRIPVAAGLGGGSSDAGTILSALGRIYNVRDESLHEIAASLGSDVPFFLRGGVALATGTGIDLTPICSTGRRWYVIVVPNVAIPGKTATLYGELDGRDFSDGSATREFAQTLTEDDWLHSGSLGNAFGRPLMNRPEVRYAASALESAGAGHVIPSGAGPSVLTLCRTYDEASRIAKGVPESAGQILVATGVSPNVNRSRLPR